MCFRVPCHDLQPWAPDGLHACRGRKKAALTYVITYCIGCATKHWNMFIVLLVGRLFCGVATSLLYSAFESWLVAEHFKVGLTAPLRHSIRIFAARALSKSQRCGPQWPAWTTAANEALCFPNLEHPCYGHLLPLCRVYMRLGPSIRPLLNGFSLGVFILEAGMQRGYDAELLGGTFSRAVFVGNGLIAIVAGLVAHSLVETLGLGPVAPFDAAALVMVFGGVIVLFSWTENFGNCSEKKSFVEQLKSGAHAIASGEACRSACCIMEGPITSASVSLQAGKSKTCSDVRAMWHQPGSVSQDEELSMQPTTIISSAETFTDEMRGSVGE